MVVLNMNGTWPPRIPCCASPPPLNGTGVISTPAMRRKISSERCGVVPMPGETFLAPPSKLRAFVVRSGLGKLAGIREQLPVDPRTDRRPVAAGSPRRAALPARPYAPRL